MSRPPRFATTAQLAALLNVSVSTIHRSLTTGGEPSLLSGAEPLVVGGKRLWSVERLARVLGVPADDLAETFAAIMPEPVGTKTKRTRRRANRWGEAVDVYEPGYF